MTDPLIDRLLAPHVAEARPHARIVAILGPRQAGKSTLVRAMGRAANMTYVTLDDEALLDRAIDDPHGLLADFPGSLVIDEIQRAPRLMLALKKLVDDDPTPGRYVITGSADLVALASIPDALPGRVDYFKLWPLTQREIEGSTSDFLERISHNDPPRIEGADSGRRAYAERIVAGGYPDALRRPPTARERLLDGLVTSTLGRDAKDVWSGDAGTATQTLSHLAARSGELLNLASLGRDVGVSGATLKAHVHALEQLFLVRRHRAWSANIDRRLVKMPKAYIADSGMLCHLLGADADRIVADDTIAGRAFETFAVMELVRLADATARLDMTFHHYRDAHQHEIDAIIELRGGDLIAIEVKSTATARSSDFSSIRRLRDDVGARLRCGLVLYAGDRTHQFEDNLHTVPISALWSDA